MRYPKPGTIFLIILACIALAACIGEATFPALETSAQPTMAPPSVDPTMEAATHLSINLDNLAVASNQPISQIPHDLIGRTDCLMCHKQGVSGAPRNPDAHRGLESNTCQTCHTAPTNTELSGPEMFNRVCAHCHGENGEGGVGPTLNVKSFLSTVTDDEIRMSILRGRGTGEMLSWGDLRLLSDRQIDEIIVMIRAWEPTAPETADNRIAENIDATLGNPEEGRSIFSQLCTGCHGLSGEAAAEGGYILNEATKFADDTLIARGIRDGGEGMPAFHTLLTTDEINDLLALIRTWETSPSPTPTPIVISGEEIYFRVCARCHGQDGEGGIGPPLNAIEFLTTTSDETIQQWIERGTLGTSMMSWGDLGLLTNNQILELVDYIRAWEPTAPSRTGESSMEPPTAENGNSRHGQQLFAQFCSGCHGLTGEHRTGPIVLNSEEFMGSVNDEILGSQIQNGGREMPSFHAILTSQDVNDLLAFMRAGFSVEEEVLVPSFTTDVFPILTEKCAACHGTLGGWGAATYDEVLNSGENAPVIIPGDPENSLLVQKLLGTQSFGTQMPPSELLSDEEIDLITSWIIGRAPDN